MSATSRMNNEMSSDLGCSAQALRQEPDRTQEVSPNLLCSQMPSLSGPLSCNLQSNLVGYLQESLHLELQVTGDKQHIPCHSLWGPSFELIKCVKMKRFEGHTRLEAQWRYFPYRAILAAIVSQKSLWGIAHLSRDTLQNAQMCLCETKY